MAGDIDQLLDISIVNEEPKLVELELDLFENLLLELLGALEDLFHGHGGGKDTGLTLDDALDELVDMVGVLVVGGDELGVLVEALRVVNPRADREDGWEDERELLGAHRLDFEGVVHRGDVESHAQLSG
ncbi:hypothetical protein DM860_005817 [Cuscuta australis]|uniref:Uncharacterized protein n=1 Tax=Cuscuta australis TaxID=267555 RepID=A0A328DWC4_9ASTE|nr:hypothetical protein DM860_005817 [Cuscuta australis]